MGWGEPKEDFMTFENHMKLKFKSPQIKCHWNTSDLFTYCLWLPCDTTAELTSGERECMACKA